VHRDPLYLRARSSNPDRTVALVAGGGSGHEPLHTGLLGSGGLDAVCPGEIFASPHNRQIYEASAAVAKSNGVLLIIKNYTGDVINFQIAAERLRHDGIPVATVLIDDDVATDNKDTATGRRGTAATVVVEKLLGAFADQGAKLDDLATLGAQIVAHSRSVAVAARAQTSPATGQPAFTLSSGTLEYGVGIHGERGTGTVEHRAIDELVRQMTDDLLAALPAGQEQVLAVVNGLGATTSLELHAIGSLLHEELTARGVQPLAIVPGTFTAALDMAGFSITLTRMKPEWVELWTAPTDTPLVLPTRILTSDTVKVAVVQPAIAQALTGVAAPSSRAVLDHFSKIVSQVQNNLTTLDQLVGDGDFGDNLAGGIRQAQTLNESGTDCMTALAEAFLNDVGGTSGPLFGLLFQQLAIVPWPDDQAPDARVVADAARASLAAIHRVGGAEVGDCTLVDALTPAIDALDTVARDSAGSPFTAAAEAAIHSAVSTASLAPRRGRASYVGDRAIGVPDPGALGVALLFTALSRVYEPNAATRLPDPQDITAR
jgi:dihydroxyacetone kinase